MPEGGEAADALLEAAFGETQSVGCAGWPVARVGVRVRVRDRVGVGVGVRVRVRVRVSGRVRG